MLPFVYTRAALSLLACTVYAVVLCITALTGECIHASVVHMHARANEGHKSVVHDSRLLAMQDALAFATDVSTQHETCATRILLA